MATRGRGSILAPFIDAILADSATAELVMVFDGPDDDAYERCSQRARTDPRLVLVSIEHRGHYGALQVGVERACSEVVLLIDDDVIAGPELVANHARHHAGRQGVVVVGSMPVESPSDEAAEHVGARLYSQEYETHCRSIQRGALAVLDGLWGGNVSIRRSDCLAVGVSSDAFPLFYHADQDFGLRLLEAGLSGVYEPQLAAAHRHRCDDAGFLRSARLHAASLVVLHRIHPERLGPFDRDSLVADVPQPMRSAIRAIGRSPRAPQVARLLLAAARFLTWLPSSRLETDMAKVARRIMMWHGTEDDHADAAPVRT